MLESTDEEDDESFDDFTIERYESNLQRAKSYVAEGPDKETRYLLRGMNYRGRLDKIR